MDDSSRILPHSSAPHRGGLAQRHAHRRRRQIALGAAACLWLAAARGSCAGRLVVCDDVQDPMTLDPQRQFTEKNHTVVQQIFEGLVRFDADGGIVPALAVSWERIDPLRMRFHLRKAVRFHNGEPFDAAAVKFSIERYLDPATGFPALGYISSIAGAEIIDEHTVDLLARRPDGLLLNRLAGFVLIVAPGHYSSRPGPALAQEPVGTGPFLFKVWDRGRRLLLGRNPEYWNPGRPEADELEFVFLPYDKQVDALLAGQVDILTNVPGTRTLEVQASTTTRIVKKPALYTMAGNFNTVRKPFSDPEVRRAVNLGIDRADLVRYDLMGNGIPVATLSMAGERGHDAGLKPYPYDPALARKLLERAGYAKGLELQVLLKANAERTGVMISRQLERIGVRMKFTLATDAELFEFFRDRDKWDMAIYSCPDPMHHAFFIRSIFLGGESPFSLAPAVELDRRAEEMAQELDGPRQDELSREIDRYIHANYLSVPTYQRVGVYGLRRGVEFVPYLSGMPYFHEVRIHGD